MSTQLLTDAELDIIDALGGIAGAFARLPEHHPTADLDDFVSLVHLLQEKVMARAARRAYPTLFVPMRPHD
jgi:hypothetical protein